MVTLRRPSSRFFLAGGKERAWAPASACSAHIKLATDFFNQTGKINRKRTHHLTLTSFDCLTLTEDMKTII